ncbi:EVE domain-containing protein [Legionella maioricensis]|uniref:UPF0310 protein LOX96_11690 n=1 Tax=Legionella maioricensis TaxID=2896528 RepID=A0A9X2IDG7_9GAMM|nr:EVE domain-containing protein [Legionella maioricensis]MCL9684758.1 EVE domain-containing protein [Legionella maioricensis]MCL9687840.1 EVE domain-containing protein [Legionella maioricensis]
MGGNWLAIASAEHVRHGRHLGIMQVCHGKATPLRRIKPGDYVIYYSPTVIFRGKDKFQSFTAIGTVKHGEPYQVNMGEGFSPFRRDVTWCVANETPISTLLNVLDFTRERNNWGYQLRFGLLQISEHDRRVIAYAMNASLETL